MVIKSSAFKNNETIPSKYTCEGDDINPLLEVSGLPENTKSLTLVVDDPDAPAGNWNHWLVWNINSKTQYIYEDSVPAGAVEGTTSFGRVGYGGPCPPKGDSPHRYFFKVYALDKELDLEEGASREDLLSAMEGSVLEQVEIVGKYQRK